MKTHTVTVNDGETLTDALRRIIAEDDARLKSKLDTAAAPVGDFALTVFEGLLEMQGVVQHMHDYAEKKLGRKAVKKIMNVPVLGGLLVMPVPTIDPDDPDDIEWFKAMMEGLGEVFADIQKLDLSQV